MHSIGYICLHNFVNIKIGIIHKNRKNIHFCLLLLCFWCIVSVLYSDLRVSYVQCYVRLSRVKARITFGGNPLSLFSLSKQRANIHQHLNNFSLILAWIAGEVIGYFVGSQVPDTVISLMRAPTFGRVSIVWLFFSAIFPFLLSIAALRLSLKRLLTSLVFLKAYGFVYSICCLGFAFGSAGWLMQLLYFFTDTLCTLIFLWFILTYPKFSKARQYHRLLLCLASTTGLVCFDYFAIMPLVLMLLNR